MKYRDLRDFLLQLERRGQLKRIAMQIDPRLEMTEICDRTLRAGGPALLFENPKGHRIPVLGNLFGTPERVAMGMGEESVGALREIPGLVLAAPSRGDDAARMLRGCLALAHACRRVTCFLEPIALYSLTDGYPWRSAPVPYMED